MKFKQYVTEVLKTESNDFVKIAERMSLPRNIRLNHASSGIMTEISELFEMVAKPQLDLTNLMEECSDAMWYIGVAVDELSINPDDFIEKCLEQRKSWSLLEKYILPKRTPILKTLSNSTISASNLIDIMKKGIFYGREIDPVKFESFMVEVMIEMIALLDLAGYDYEEAMDINIKKLQKKRFKAGKFTEQEAIVRNLDEERKTLEKKD